MSNKETYSVTVSAVDVPVQAGADFSLTVTTTNISGKVLYEVTNSAYYNRGVPISLTIQADGITYFLMHNWYIMTDDIKTRKIEIDETIVCVWKFSTNRRFTEIDSFPIPAPIGKYMLSVSDLYEIPDFLEIVSADPSAE